MAKRLRKKIDFQRAEGWDESYHDALLSDLETEHSKAEPIPASDRNVTIDHNSAVYQEAIEKLDSATDAIRGFNGETEYNKEQVVGELEAAKTLLKSPTVRVGAIAAVLLDPLLTAYNDVATEATNH